MPRTKTAKKEARKNVRRRAKNNARKDNLKTIIKNYERSVVKGEAVNLNVVYKALDKAAKARIIKPNKANRLKSRLAKKQKKRGK